MKTVHMTRGLPGSGKSTWAREKMAEHPGAYKRVNKDDLRALLDNGHWSRDNEKFILRMRDIIIAEALEQGKHVIVDDTNFRVRHEPRLRQLAHENGAAFEVVDFTHVPVDECIKRDLKRLNSVGEAVIRKMWREFLAPEPPVIKHNPGLPGIIICDIDGTVALMDGRSPYDYSLVHTDAPHAPVIAAVEQLSTRYSVIFVSGRKAICRDSTAAWIATHLPNVRNVLGLLMRADGDDRDDRIVKEEIYRREIEGKYNVVFVLDDRQRVVDRWRQLGLTCFQVAAGDF